MLFVVVALVGNVLGFGRIAGTAAGIAQVRFSLFLIIVLVSLLAGLASRGRALRWDGAAVRRPWRVAMLAAAFALAFTAGCQKEGPAERAGKQVDRAAQKASGAVEDARDKAEEAVD